MPPAEGGGMEITMEICQYEFQFQNEFMGIIEKRLLFDFIYIKMVYYHGIFIQIRKVTKCLII